MIAAGWLTDLQICPTYLLRANKVRPDQQFMPATFLSDTACPKLLSAGLSKTCNRRRRGNHLSSLLLPFLTA